MDLHHQLKYFNQEMQRQQQFKPKAKMNDYTNFSQLTPSPSAARKQVNVKMAQQQNSNPQQTNNAIFSIETFAQIQRKICSFVCSFVCIYAIIILTLYVIYACYYFYQNNHQHHHNNIINTKLREPQESQLNGNVFKSSQLLGTESAIDQQQQLAFIESASKLESKIHLLERYIELIAVDLQETKNRLKEREKCDCSISCTFNNTNYADGSTWQSQCDICTCKFGKISCVPQKCPETKCDVVITLPGQCCPTCMKSCKYNNRTIQHGQKFSPQSNSTTTNQIKECKCNDGLIKCEQKFKKINNPLSSEAQKIRTKMDSKRKSPAQDEDKQTNNSKVVTTNNIDHGSTAAPPTTTTTTRKPNQIDHKVDLEKKSNIITGDDFR